MAFSLVALIFRRWISISSKTWGGNSPTKLMDTFIFSNLPTFFAKRRFRFAKLSLFFFNTYISGAIHVIHQCFVYGHPGFCGSSYSRQSGGQWWVDRPLIGGNLDNKKAQILDDSREGMVTPKITPTCGFVTPTRWRPTTCFG